VEVRQLRHVLALVEGANFHKAARALGLTQPALSKSLQQIERELGQRLFDRHGKAVVPTVFGEIAARAARDVLGALEGMTRAIGQAANLDAGELSVGAGSYVADVWLGQVAGRLSRRYPRLHLTLHVEHWSDLPELLLRGRIDLFVASIEHVRDRKQFRVVAFPQEQGVWVCRAGHPLAHAKRPRRSALGDYTLIGPPVPESLRRWFEADPAGSRALRRKIDTTSVTMIKAMIREGDALSVVHPDTVRSEVAHGEFVTLDLDAPPVLFQPGLVWLSDRSLSPAAAAFAEELLVEVGMDGKLPTG
jgi:DNA-binding transcriptional LysR family regulator